MKKLTENLKQMLDALAFAHAGDYLTQREKTQILAQAPRPIKQVPATAEPVVMDKCSSARRIALYLGNELPAEVMDYVIQTCARVQHELTVLTFETESCARDLLEPHQRALEAAGVNMKLEVLSSEQPIAGINRYLRNHPEVAFLTCKDTGYLGRSYLSGTRNQNSLPVPVVVVTTQAQAGRKAAHPATDQNRPSSSVA